MNRFLVDTSAYSTSYPPKLTMIRPEANFNLVYNRSFEIVVNAENVVGGEMVEFNLFDGASLVASLVKRHCAYKQQPQQQLTLPRNTIGTSAARARVSVWLLGAHHRAIGAARMADRCGTRRRRCAKHYDV
jgi:hypothetical protein